MIRPPGLDWVNVTTMLQQPSRVTSIHPNNFSYEILEKEFIFSRAVGVQQFY